MSEELLFDGSSGDPTVVWYDPGGTTGWTVFSVHPDALLDPECRVMDNITHFGCGEIYGNEFMQVDAMIALSEAWPGAVLGTEQFVMYDSSAGRKDSNLLVLERLNAAFRYGLHQRRLPLVEVKLPGGKRTHTPPILLGEDGRPIRVDPPKVYRQNAAIAMESVTDARLKAWGYWERTTGLVHARDAIRHALTFLKRVKTQPRLRAEAFPRLTGPILRSPGHE